MDAVEGDKTGELEKILVNFLTTNHTYFMREFEHFEYFKHTVLPWLKVKAGRSRDLRIWCGAASTGEEPYMIAMVIADFFGVEKGQWDTKILATDISTKVLRQALTGVYSAEQLKNLPDQWKRHFFKSIAGGTQYKVTEELKQEVIFRQFNLMNRIPFKRKMRRNVNINHINPVCILLIIKSRAEVIKSIIALILIGNAFFQLFSNHVSLPFL